MTKPSNPGNRTPNKGIVECAIANVADRLPAIARSLDVDVDTGLKFLSGLAEHIQGTDLPDPPDGLAWEMLLFEHLLEEIRSELLELSAHDPAAGLEALDGLRWVHSVQQRLTDGDSDDLAALRVALRGPDLLVELAHDLRSPLTSILFLSETLRDGHGGSLNELQQEQLGIIYSAAFSMVAMASDVIELVRGGRPLIEQPQTPFSIRQIFQSISDVVRPMIEDRTIEFRTHPPERDLRLGLPVALSRVLLNLTTNAIRHTETGFVELTATALEGDRVEFAVRDSGSGFDSAALPDIYRPIRARTGGRGIGFSGAGLGLSICRNLLDRMGSELHVESAPGKGSRFYFTLSLPGA